eukprot:Selendium_serpulae@DN6390_c5_g1_i10.p1
MNIMTTRIAILGVYLGVCASIGSADSAAIRRWFGFFDPNKTDAYGQSQLSLAAKKGDNDAVTKLLQGGANVNAKPGNRTALYAAARQGHTETVKLLLKAGADVRARDCFDNFKETAFFTAVQFGRTDVVRLLLDEMRKLNRPDNKSIVNWRNETPMNPPSGAAIHHAAFKGYADILDALVSHPNIDINAETFQLPQKTALTLGIENLLETSEHGFVKRKRSEFAWIDEKDNLLNITHDTALRVVETLLKAGAVVKVSDMDSMRMLSEEDQSSLLAASPQSA